MGYGGVFFYGVCRWSENMTGGGQGNGFVIWCSGNGTGLVCVTFYSCLYGLRRGHGRGGGAEDGHYRLCLVFCLCLYLCLDPCLCPSEQ
ncbi:hypothetical protein Hanom_Chr16g01448351 [Helianthus anomalus]